MSTEPLASRMRPKNIDEIISQQHLVGPKGIIRRMVDTKRLSSMIFYGPPGIECRNKYKERYAANCRRS